MKKKKTFLKKRLMIPKRFRARRWYVFFSISLILIFFFGILKVQDNQRKNDAKKQVDALLQNLELNGERIYRDSHDNGCETGQRGFLGSSTTCVYEGDLLVRNTDKLEERLRELDDYLVKKEWHRITHMTSQAEGDELFEKRFAAISDSGLFKYYNNSPNEDRLNIQMLYYKSSSNLQEKLKDNHGVTQLVSIGEGEYIYGIHITAVYRESMAPFGWFGK